MRNKRVLLAGLFHETHTFVDGRTSRSDFQSARGPELLNARGDASPLAGAVDYGTEAGWEFLPTVDLRANPSATVDDAVLEEFWEEFRRVAEPELARGVDGIYLVLHGAMVTESDPDVEGEVLSRIRALKGAGRVPICGVLDLHGNVTPRMAELSHGLVAYRENPHIDAKAAAIDGARLLDRLMKTGERPVTLREQPPVMWPAPGTGTGTEPMKGLERLARAIESSSDSILFVNVFAGFAFADTPETGVSFTAIVLGDEEKARAGLARLRDYALEHKAKGNVWVPPIAEIMPKLREHSRGPVLLVEPSDNIGGGAPGDGTGVLRALIEHDISDAAVVIADPGAVAEVSSRSKGATARVRIGGKRSRLDPGPVELDVELVSTSSGRFELEDPQSHLASMFGRRIEMGPCAVVCHRGIDILLTSRATPPFDLGQLRSQGIVPEKCFVIGVKAAVAHRRAYDPIAAASYTVDTPGPCSTNLRAFPYRRIRRPIYPLDEE